MKRQQAKKRREITPEARLLIKQVLIGLGTVVSISVVLVAIWFGTRLDVVTISEVQVSGGETVSDTALRVRIEEELSGSYFHLIPRRFAWLYPEQAIREVLLEYDRIDTVSIVLRGGTVLEVSFTEHLPAALWCAEDDLTTCLFINADSYAFATAPRLAGGSFIRYVTPGREPVVRHFVAHPDVIAEVAWLTRQLEEQFEFLPVRVKVYSDDRVTFELAGESMILTSLRTDVTQTLRYLDTLLQAEEFRHFEPGNFQYIDIRFGNKLFVNEDTPRTIPTDEDRALLSETAPHEESIMLEAVSSTETPVFDSDSQTEPAPQDVLPEPVPVDELEIVEVTEAATSSPSQTDAEDDE